MIKWTGSKSWLAPAFKNVDGCAELFAGAAHVSFRNAKRIMLNDTCEPLIETYERLRNDKDNFVNSCEEVFNSIQSASDPKSRFVEVRNSFNSGKLGAEGFVTILYAGFNGLWRESSRGCNVPYGGPRKFSRDHLTTIPVERIELLRKGDWRDFEVPEDYLTFADPPYAGAYTGYNRLGWTHAQNEELFEFLSNRKGPVVITCRDTPENRKALGNRKFDFVSVTKLYTNGAKGSTKAGELVAFNDDGNRFLIFREVK